MTNHVDLWYYYLTNNDDLRWRILTRKQGFIQNFKQLTIAKNYRCSSLFLSFALPVLLRDCIVITTVTSKLLHKKRTGWRQTWKKGQRRSKRTKQNKIKSMAVWSELSNKIRRKGRRLTTEKRKKKKMRTENKTNKTTQNKQNG